MTIRLIICDDQAVVREGLRTILGTAENIQVLAVANNGAEAVDLAGKLKPDLILMDLKMPVMNGILATKLIRQAFPDIKVLVLTTYDADEWVFDAIRNGASGFLLKDTPSDELIQNIMLTVEGKTIVDPSIAGKLFSHIAQSNTPIHNKTIENLTDRELDVLRLLSKGASNLEISQVLFLSEGTIRNYLSTIFNKLGVSDRTQAAVMAIQAGLSNDNLSPVAK